VAETKAGRDWVNAAAKTMISFIASMKVPFFDIGEVPPRITGATMVPTTRDNAFVRVWSICTLKLRFALLQNFHFRRI
jgi:hypothetical protein